MIFISKYKKLLGNSLSEFESMEIKAFVPTLADMDYKKGYVKRYFTQKANDESSYIFEISKEKFGELKQNPFYKCVSLNWRITGDSDVVKESNRKSLKLAAETLKSISLYLPNKLQFYKK